MNGEQRQACSQVLGVDYLDWKWWSSKRRSPASLAAGLQQVVVQETDRPCCPAYDQQV